jgi:hypothetical protein
MEVGFHGIMIDRKPKHGFWWKGVDESMGKGLFQKKAAKPDIPYDAARQRPVVRCSICTGEQVAGFKDVENGQFTEVMLIRNDADLERFKKTYGLENVTKEY